MVPKPTVVVWAVAKCRDGRGAELNSRFGNGEVTAVLNRAGVYWRGSACRRSGFGEWRTTISAETYRVIGNPSA